MYYIISRRNQTGGKVNRNNRLEGVTPHNVTTCDAGMTADHKDSAMEGYIYILYVTHTKTNIYINLYIYTQNNSKHNYLCYVDLQHAITHIPTTTIHI